MAESALQVKLRELRAKNAAASGATGMVAAAASISKASQAKVDIVVEEDTSVTMKEAVEISNDIKFLELGPEAQALAGFNVREFENEYNTLYERVADGTGGLGVILSQINKQLRLYPALTYMLSDAQKGIVVKGMLTHKNIALVPTKPKSATKKATTAAAKKKEVLAMFKNPEALGSMDFNL